MHRNSAMNQYTVGEVATRFHVTDKTVAKWIQSKALTAAYYPNEKPAYLISKEAIDAFEEAYKPYLSKPRGRGCEVIPRKVLKQKALEAANMEKHDIQETAAEAFKVAYSITKKAVDDFEKDHKPCLVVDGDSLLGWVTGDDDNDGATSPTFYAFEEEHHPFEVVEYHDGDKVPDSRAFIELINDGFSELTDIRKKLNEMDKAFIEVWNVFINQWFDGDSDARDKFVRLMHESPNYKQLEMEFDTKKDILSTRLKNCGLGESVVDAMLGKMEAD